MDPEEFKAKYAPWYVKRSYKNVLTVPDKPWSVHAVWREAYFSGAKHILMGVVDGRFMPETEGVTGVFLFRHYLELHLKYIVFHSRWLRTARENADRDEIQSLYKSHSLMALWNSVKGEAKGKIPQAEWDALDTAFVEQCVKEFESVDPHPGWRFRYHGPEFGIDRRPAQERVPIVDYLHVDFHGLLDQMDHIYDVLNAVDVYLVESHGENAEWAAEQSSW
jgi:hypothetical protein